MSSLIALLVVVGMLCVLCIVLMLSLHKADKSLEERCEQLRTAEVGWSDAERRLAATALIRIDSEAQIEVVRAIARDAEQRIAELRDLNEQRAEQIADLNERLAWYQEQMERLENSDDSDDVDDEAEGWNVRSFADAVDD